MTQAIIYFFLIIPPPPAKVSSSWNNREFILIGILILFTLLFLMVLNKRINFIKRLSIFLVHMLSSFTDTFLKCWNNPIDELTQPIKTNTEIKIFLVQMVLGLLYVVVFSYLSSIFALSIFNRISLPIEFQIALLVSQFFVACGILLYLTDEITNKLYFRTTWICFIFFHMNYVFSFYDIKIIKSIMHKLINYML